ncbi:MAG TPA: hypothetical protein PKY59_15475 [Pyrinomonadaceae bacterium]|nr:hypothetical protein [Pyrinomonadaceae bacterium]
MLNFTIKGTYQDASGYDWDYYGDDTDPSTFYIIPRPQFVLDSNNNPSFQITRYATDGAGNGAGFLRFDVELAVPQTVETAITAQIPTFFPNAQTPYKFSSLQYNNGGTAYFYFADGSGNITYSAPVSSYGSNAASFLLQMTKEQLDTAVNGFSTGTSAFQVEYKVSVPARLPAVTATLSFDSSIAYQYQVTQPSYDSWGDETSPGSVQTLLNESASTKVNIEWGTSNPSDALRQAVSDWANDTIADLVTAEVQETIKLQGLSSDNSFNINEVSSFTNTYSENMVVDWVISPKAALPVLQNIQSFIASVNEQQQKMTVSAFLPFAANNGFAEIMLNSQDYKNVAVLVDQVTVTVNYPGLQEADATYTFTYNESQTFTAPFDETQGSAWGLEYTVTYKDTSMNPVTGTVSDITEGTFTLQLAAAGIFTVTFDAQQAFTGEGTQPTEIDVSLSYINSDGNAPIIQETIKILKTDNPQKGNISSYQPIPLDSSYNYQVTYIYPGNVTYKAPLVQGATGYSQIIPASNAVHSCNVIVYVPASQASSSPIFDATVQMWYAAPPNLPSGVGTQPTKDSPAVYTITPQPDSTGNLFARETFVGFINGDQPLVYSASIDAVPQQIDINDAMVENDQASIMITATQQYFTLQIDPTAINWSTATFESVEVVIKAKVAQGTASTAPNQPPPRPAIIWNKGESGIKYLTLSISAGNTVSYDWEINYVTSGSPVKTTSGTGASDVILNIPASPSAKYETKQNSN